METDKPSIKDYVHKRRRNESVLAAHEAAIFEALAIGTSQQLILVWLKDVQGVEVSHSTLAAWVRRRVAARAQLATTEPDGGDVAAPVPRRKSKTLPAAQRQDTSELKSAEKSQSRNAVKAVPESQPTTEIDPYAESMAIVNKGLLSK